VVEMSD